MRAALPHDIGPRGPFVSPGNYTVSIDADGTRASTTVRVIGDPKLPLTLAQHREREAFLLQIVDLQREVNEFSQKMAAASRDLTARRDAAAAGSPERAAAEDRLQRLTTIGRGLVGGRGGGAGRLGGIAGSFNGSGAQQGSLYPPTGTHKAAVREVRAALTRAQADLASVQR